MVLKILDIIARLIIGGAFIYAGVVKIQGPLQFAATLESYRLLPQVLVPWAVTILPRVEVALGAMVLVGWKRRYFGAAAAVLLVIFIGAMGITYARGIEADCGCFGPGDRISPLTLLRDTLFLVPALYLIFEPRKSRS